MTGAGAIISNGTGLFPLGWLAAEMAGLGRLDRLLTAGYLKPPIAGLVSSSSWLSDRLVRLRGRTVDLAPDRIKSLWLPEVLYQIAAATRGRRGLGGMSAGADIASIRAYAAGVARMLSAHPDPPRIYHYRAAFGLQSVAVARRRGMVAVCHHTSAHPLTVAPLNRNRGRKPTAAEIDRERGSLDPLQALILRDIGQADFVVAESEFEVETFRWADHAADAVRAFYPGIDPVFRSLIPAREPRRPGPPRLLFAGTLTERKGVGILQDALAAAPDLDLTLEVAGAVSPAAAVMYRGLLSDRRVRILGVLPRAALAARMAAADIFVLPTFSEGSARVLFEALACGALVVTTPNSGTVARDGINGVIVPPGDPTALLTGIGRAIGMADLWPAMAERNRRLALDDHAPSRCVADIAALYDELAGGAAP